MWNCTLYLSISGTVDTLSSTLTPLPPLSCTRHSRLYFGAISPIILPKMALKIFLALTKVCSVLVNICDILWHLANHRKEHEKWRTFPFWTKKSTQNKVCSLCTMHLEGRSKKKTGDLTWLSVLRWGRITSITWAGRCRGTVGVLVVPDLWGWGCRRRHDRIASCPSYPRVHHGD